MCLKAINGLFLFVATFLFQGCTSIKDLSSQSPYAEWMGRQYVLEQDCYVFKVNDNPSVPFVGRDLYRLPADVAPQFVDEHSNEDKILGILQKGSKFTIVGIHEVRNIEGVVRDFEATFDEKTGRFHGAVLNVRFLTDWTKIPPVFNETLAMPVPQAK